MIVHPINTLDLYFQNTSQTIASYLVEGPKGPVLIETGPGSTLQNLLEQLSRHGYQPIDIQHIIVTHIHFDHAGAAGWWAQQGSTIYVHHFGAPHLIQPDRLIRSATRIYGDQMDPLWGEILPAPKEKVVSLFDGDTIEVGGLSFRVIETPGHARHHHVIQLGEFAFTGDAAGIKLGDSPLLDIPAPPPEFDLEAWQHSLDRLLQMNFRTIYPTHFGKVEEVKLHLEAIKALLNESAYLVRHCLETGMERDQIQAEYQAWYLRRGEPFGLNDAAMQKYEVTNPLYMSVDGILRYWQKKVEQ